MLGGLDPKKMKGMMKQLGIEQEEIDASKVIIEKIDGGKIVIEEPQVVRVSMKGQNSYQISGEEVEESSEVGITEEDVKLVMEKTGKNADESRNAIEETGDIAEAIVKLSE